MRYHPRFIELEDHVIRIANIIRVSVEQRLESEHLPNKLPLMNDEEKKENFKRGMAYDTGYGCWLENTKRTINMAIGPELVVVRRTLVEEYYVRIHGSRAIVLRHRSSYEKLKEAMGI